MSKFLNFFSRKDIRNATVGGVAVKFGSTLFTLLNGILLARYLSLEWFGYYVIVISTVALLSIPITLGMPSLITRYVSKYVVYNDYASIKGLLVKTNQIAGCAVLIVYTVLAITYFLWWKRFDAVLVETLLCGLLLLPLLGFGALRSAALRGLKLIVLADFPDTLFRNGAFFISIAVCILSGISLTPQRAILLNILVSAFAFVIGFFLLRKNILLQIQPIKALFHTAEWVKQTIPFTINSGIVILKSKLLTYILAIFGSIEAVALFDVAMRGASFVSFILDALNQAISPFASSAFERRNMPALQRIIKKMSRIIFAISLPVALIFIIGGKPLLIFIFGSEYEFAYVPLVILCIGQLISAMTGSVGLVLSMSGHQAVFSNSNIFFLVISIIASIPFVIHCGVIGAALVYSGVLILQNVMLLYIVWNKMRINTTIF